MEFHINQVHHQTAKKKIQDCHLSKHSINLQRTCNNLSAISIKPDTKFSDEIDGSLLDGAVKIKGEAFRIDESS